MWLMPPRIRLEPVEKKAGKVTIIYGMAEGIKWWYKTALSPNSQHSTCVYMSNWDLITYFLHQ